MQYTATNHVGLGNGHLNGCGIRYSLHGNFPRSLASDPDAQTLATLMHYNIHWPQRKTDTHSPEMPKGPPEHWQHTPGAVHLPPTNSAGQMARYPPHLSI